MDAKSTEKEQPIYSTLSRSSIGPAIEAVAQVLMVVRPEEEQMKETVGKFMEASEFDLERLNHRIEVETWKDKSDPEKLAVLEKTRSEFYDARSEVESNLVDSLADGLMQLLQSLRKIDQILSEEGTPEVGVRIRQRS